MHVTTPILAFSALALLAGTQGPLRTDYAAERSLRITTETELSLETTDFSMTIDGQPAEGRAGRMGGGGSEDSTRTVHVDTVMVAEEGERRVRRRFEELESSIAFGEGEQARELDRSSELEGVTLEITREDGELTVTVLEGDEPEQEALAGHAPELSLDALLPPDDVSEGDTWEIESADVLRALGLETRLFGLGGDDQERDGGVGGRRGGGGGGFGPGNLLREAEWEGSAKLVDEGVEKNGVACVAIELELRAEGEQEDRGFGVGRGRFALGSTSASRALETTYTIEIDGELFFSRAEGRPVVLELRGTISTERISERERDGSTLVMEMSQEGTFEHSVSIEAIERAFASEEEGDDEEGED